MANILDEFIPDLYTNIDIISRELVGFFPAVTHMGSEKRAAVGQTVKSYVAPASAPSPITPGQLPPNTGDQEAGHAKIKITNSESVVLKITGEEELGINHSVGHTSILGGQILQAMRGIVNKIETGMAQEYYKASRAYGTPGTTPFSVAGNYDDAAQVLKILKDNGSPTSDAQLVLDTSAGARFLGRQAQADMAGTDSIQRQGLLVKTAGMELRESGQSQYHIKGTGDGYVVDGALPKGATEIPIDGGSGTIIAGDVVVFAGDPRKYMISTDLAGGVCTIAAPGLMQPILDNSAVTIGENYTANVAFSRSAFSLITRLPAIPSKGEMAIDSHVVTDPRSGLSFDLRVYPGYHQTQFEIGASWGHKLTKPEHSAILYG